MARSRHLDRLPRLTRIYNARSGGTALAYQFRSTFRREELFAYFLIEHSFE